MYAIHPIEQATLRAPKDLVTYRIDREETVVFPILSFLVTATDPGDDTAVLVDTGIPPADDDYLRERGQVVGDPGGGPEPLLDGLAAHGVAPGDVDVVVLTHLHNDHCANCEPFEDAEFVVQARELEAARDPLPILASPYLDRLLDVVEAMDPTVVSGRHRLREGLELVPTPGHTEGSQTLLVETAGGTHALVADLAYTRHNLDPSVPSIVDASGRTVEVTRLDHDYLPPGIHTDVGACYESVERVRELVGPAGVLVPGHDPEYAERYPTDG